jgi:hypothetical protein
MAKAAAVDDLPEVPEKNLLAEHLQQKKDLLLENTFRVLAIHGKDPRMRTVFRGLFSRNARQRSNSIELLGDIMDKKLFKMFEPLLEGDSPGQILAAGRKFFKLPGFKPAQSHLLPALLVSPDWIEAVLAEQIDRRQPEDPIGRPDAKEPIMTELSVSEKILHLKNIAIFANLTVSELGAIATVTEEKDYPAGETVITEGEPGEEVFLIIEGEVSVCKGRQAEKQIKLDTMDDGDYFGEMALFEEAERSATIRTEKPSRFLVLHKKEFNELVREYPSIALQICTALSQRLRHLHEKVAEAEPVPDTGEENKCK